MCIFCTILKKLIVMFYVHVLRVTKATWVRRATKGKKVKLG